MSTIKNIELIDDVRNDALILMKNNPELTYDQAYNQAKQKLIGDEKISTFEFQPFEVDVDNTLLNETETSKEVEVQDNIETGNEPVKEQVELSEKEIIEAAEKLPLTDEQKSNLEILKKLEGLDVDYYGSIKTQLAGIIDVEKFNNDQLEQLYIGKKMGVDITKIFNNKLTAQQIKFLCVLLATGKDITNYVIDPNFDVEEAFVEAMQ